VEARTERLDGGVALARRVGISPAVWCCARLRRQVSWSTAIHRRVLLPTGQEGGRATSAPTAARLLGSPGVSNPRQRTRDRIARNACVRARESRETGGWSVSSRICHAPLTECPSQSATHPNNGPLKGSRTNLLQRCARRRMITGSWCPVACPRPLSRQRGPHVRGPRFRGRRSQLFRPSAV